MSQFALSLNQFPDSGDANSLFPRSAVTGPTVAPVLPNPYPPGAPGAALSDRQGTRAPNPNVADNNNASPYAPADGVDAQNSARYFPLSTDRNRMNAQVANDTQPRYGAGAARTWTG